MSDADALKGMLYDAFTAENVYAVETVVLLSLMDVTMLRFLPWKKSRVFDISEGFPCSSVLKVCLGTKSIQVCISFISQLIFVSSSDSENTAMSSQENALFALNTISGIADVIMLVVVLFFRGAVIQNLETKEKNVIEGKETEAGAADGGEGSRAESSEEAAMHTKYVHNSNTGSEQASSVMDHESSMSDNPLVYSSCGRGS